MSVTFENIYWAKSRHNKTAGYTYSWLATFPNLQLTSTTAYHGIDIPVLFGTSEEITQISDTITQREFGKFVRGVWADFVRDPKFGLERRGLILSDDGFVSKSTSLS